MDAWNRVLRYRYMVYQVRQAYRRLERDERMTKVRFSQCQIANQVSSTFVIKTKNNACHTKLQLRNGKFAHCNNIWILRGLDLVLNEFEQLISLSFTDVFQPSSQPRA